MSEANEGVLPADHAEMYSDTGGGGPAAEPAVTTEPEAPAEPAAPEQTTEPTAAPATPAEPAQPEAVDPFGHLPREELSKRYGDLQGAVGEERGRRKAAEARAQQTEGLLAKISERIGQAQPVQPDAPAAPDPDADPLAYQDWQQGEMLKALEKLTGRVDTIQQTGEQLTAQQQKQGQLASYTQADEARFTQLAPDYLNAYTFMKQARDQELTLMGMADPTQRQRQIHADELNLMELHMINGTSPAEAVYAMAQARGFKAQAQPAPNGGASGAQEPAAAQAKQRLATVNKAAQAAASLSGAGGEAPNQPSTLTEIAEAMDSMGGKEFDAAFERLRKTEEGGNSVM